MGVCLNTSMNRDGCLFEYQYDSKMYYVGKIITVSDKKITDDFLQFMLKGNDNEHAKFLEKPNAICEADHDQIVLDNPMTPSKGSKRQNAYLQFPFDFSSYRL